MKQIRLNAVMVVALLVVIFTAAPVSAATATKGPIAKLAGDLAGVTTWGQSVPGCLNLHQEFDATYRGRAGAGDVILHVEVCISPEGTPGTFTLTARAGTLSGTVTGSFRFRDDGRVQFDFDLVPTEGTKRFTRLRGTLHFSSAWTIGSPEGSPFQATVTVNA